MKILIGCEESQVVTKEFRALGHDAYSCDIIECSGCHPEWHIIGDVREQLTKGWDMGIFFTPCTFSCNSGVTWLSKNGIINKERMSGVIEYAGMLRECLNSDIPKVACENPIPHKYALEVIGRKYDQIIHPWMFGHPESKSTCLWLKNLPPLMATDDVSYIMSKLPKNQQQRLHYLPPSPDRSKLRSKTFTGIAKAMAEQWG